MPPDVVENTAYSQKILESYEKALAKRKEQYAAEQKKKKQQQKKKGAAASPHASAKEPLKGVLAKGDNYAQNGHDYLKDDGGRNKAYKDVSHAKLANIKPEKLEHFKFPNSSRSQNFNPGAKYRGKKAGQRYPYVWEAHHMLPGSAFYYELDGKLCFTAVQRRLILQSEYNINHGHNIMMLPDQAWAVPIHRMIQHPGDHPNYTLRVMKDLRKLAKQIQELIDKGAKHEKVSEKLFEKLRKLEDDYWEFLVTLGRKSVAAVLAGTVLVDINVRYGTKKNATKFTWGSLY